ncbi:MAG: NAD(P)-dependent oxidoreductase, partial [Verrucomicrobiota bacterium]
MSLLITGGLGYLGYEVLHAASRARPGEPIVALGRGPLPSGISLPEDVVYERGSILDEAFFGQVLKRHKVKEIVHAAGARTSECAADPHQAIESNVFGTDAVFRAARAWGMVEKIIFVSSGAVYGKTTEPIDETATVSAGTPYAIAKAAAEMVARGHAEKAGFQTAIVRPGFVMGPSSSGTPKASKLNAVVGEAMNR